MNDLAKIEKIFRMLGSTHDGEILNAVYAIRNVLLAQNKNFSDLAKHLFKGKPDFSAFHQHYEQERPKYDAPPRSRYDNPRTKNHKEMAEYLINMGPTMTNWESTFVSDIMEKNLSKMRSLSDKQAACLERIHADYMKKNRAHA